MIQLLIFIFAFSFAMLLGEGVLRVIKHFKNKK